MTDLSTVHRSAQPRPVRAPRGAEIRVNGQPQGNTPKRIVKSGQPEPLNIEIVKDGYEASRALVVPQPGQSPRIEVKLRELPAAP